MKKNKPIRIQRKRTKGWKMPENTVYVGRGSEWGNPFKVGIDGNSVECLNKFADYFQSYKHMGGTMEEFYTSMINYERAVEALKGKNLACWCDLSGACHADYLLRLVND